MNLLDRHIIARYLSNFALLFALLFIFAVAIDVVVQFDEFAQAAASVAERDDRWYPAVLFQAVVDFHGPRAFQFFAFMTGLVGVGAAGFTIVQMHRSRELIAIMAAGVPLHRVAVALLAAQMGVVTLQLLDQEFLLPGLASRLIREHDDILTPGVETFEVPLMRDAKDDLLYAENLDPRRGEAEGLLVIRRDADGTAVARITADTATWDETQAHWRLDGGRIMETTSMEGRLSTRRELEFWESDLSPRMLLARQSMNFAQMLSVSQLRDLRNAGDSVDRRLDRAIFGRFAGVLVNLLVPAIVIPFFLLRSPSANMLQQSLKAAAVAIPLLLGSLATMTISLPGLPPAVSTFLPVAILLPLAIGRLAYLRS